MAKYSLQECKCHICHFIERGWMNVQLFFAYLLFETINMSAPFFSIPSITQLNGADIFWTSLVSLKRITVYNQPKECTKFFKGKSKQKSTNTLHQVWFCLPSIWAVKWIPIKSSLHFLPAHPAPILPLSSSYKRSRRLASQWSIAWRVLEAYTHNLRNELGGKQILQSVMKNKVKSCFTPPLQNYILTVDPAELTEELRQTIV